MEGTISIPHFAVFLYSRKVKIILAKHIPGKGNYDHHIIPHPTLSILE
jgi:hypothetical protein